MSVAPDTAVRPVPRFVRAWAVLTVLVAVLLLFVLGGFVTSFRVGMADPVWPTEPWYLVGKDWKTLEFGFLVEHTHRAAGWVVGAMVSVLAVAAWWGEPNRAVKWFGLAAIVALLATYGEFHRGMMAVEKLRREGQPLATLPWPAGAGVATAVAAGACLLACGVALSGHRFGRWARAAAVVALVAVMVQGLLGGFRVLLNQLAGTELAAYHGVFAQVVLTLLCVVVALAAPRRPGDALPDADRDRLTGPALLLPAVVFVQLVWAVWVRHMGSPVAQRLHILTAFVVTGLVVWLCARTLAAPAGRRQLGFAAYHLLAIVAVQVLLGVEAYLAKFAAAGRYATMLPMDRPPQAADAAVRTAHAVIGAALLASSVVFALRVTRRPVAEATPDAATESAEAARIGGPVVASPA